MARYLIKHGVSGKTVGYDTVKAKAISKAKAYTAKHGVQSYVCDTLADNAQIFIARTEVAPVAVVNAMIAEVIADIKPAPKAKPQPAPKPVCLARSIGWYGLFERLGDV